MTLPGSGPISLNALAAEFALPTNTPFPSGYYGKGGAPISGALSLADFYGRSNFSLTIDTVLITAGGYGDSDTANVTSAVSTNFTFTVVSGSASGRIAYGPSSGTSTTVTVSTPLAGNGSILCTIRVTATNGDYVEVDCSADWGFA